MSETVNRLDKLRGRLNTMSAQVKTGRVVQVTGLIIESEGPDLALGELCSIESERNGLSIEA